MKQVYFTDKMEIRMGSPFNHCKLEFEGFNLSDLSKIGFQDICSWGQNHKYLILVKWNIMPNNEPGFNIIALDTEKEEIIFSSERVAGICTSLSLENNQLKYGILFKGNEIKRSIQIK